MELDRGTVLFVLLPERGAFNASFVLAKELRARGYRVAYLGPKDHSEHVIAQGLEYLIVSPPESPKEVLRFRLFRKWREKRSRYKAGYRAFRDILSAADEQIKVLAPAVALLDPLMWRYAGPLLANRVPVVGLNTTLAWRFNLDTPPVFSDMLPNDGPRLFQRLRNATAWIPILLRESWSQIREDVNRVAIMGPRGASRYRARSIVAQNGGRLAIGEYGPRLIAPEVVLAPAEFDFPGAPRTNGRIYAGSCVDMDRQDVEFDWSQINDDKPLLYCSLGTYSKAYPNAKRLFGAVVEAFKDRTDWQLVVQIGDAVTGDELGPVPSHIVLAKATPQIALLRRAALFITHGGFSSVREGTILSVPMVVFPCWLDQPGNAARVVFHRLGLRGDISTVTSDDIAALVQAAQGDTIRQNMAAMSERFLSQTGCEHVVDWLEGYAALGNGRYKDAMEKAQ